MNIDIPEGEYEARCAADPRIQKLQQERRAHASKETIRQERIKDKLNKQRTAVALANLAIKRANQALNRELSALKHLLRQKSMVPKPLGRISHRERIIKKSIRDLMASEYAVRAQREFREALKKQRFQAQTPNETDQGPADQPVQDPVPH